MLIATSTVCPAIYETMEKNNETMNNYETFEDTEESTTNYPLHEEETSTEIYSSDEQALHEDFSAPTIIEHVGNSPKTFGFYLNAGHFWKPFFSKFNIQLGYYPGYPNYYGGGYYNVKHPKLWDIPGILVNKAFNKAAAVLSWPKGTYYNDFSNKNELKYVHNYRSKS